MKLSIIFPAVNESAVIVSTLTEAIRDLEQLGYDYEVLVVDNCSRDNTVELVKQFAAAHPRVRVIVHPENLGYANSNLTGYRNATGDVIAVVDSDGQHHLSDLPLFFEQLDQGMDAVFGWRKVRHDPAIRKVVSIGLSLSSKLLLKWPHHDINCGFRVVKAEVARSITSVKRVNYFGPELWVHCARHGYKVGEVIARHSERAGGVSINAPWRLPLNMWKAFQYLLDLRQDLATEVPVRAKSSSVS